MLTLLGLLAAGGCASTAAPHVTAKVIYQHEDLAAELSTEWNR